MDGRVKKTGPRYYALDSIRAAAMLLGVVYHAILFGDGINVLFLGGTPTPSTRFMDWLHSFRMPLFFLIAGFFSRMMCGKHGFGRYLTRRWWRLGASFVLVLFILGTVRGLGAIRAGASESLRGGEASSPKIDEDGPRPWDEAIAARHRARVEAEKAPSPIAERLFGESSRHLSLQHLWFLWYLLVFSTLAPPVAAGAGWLFLRHNPEAIDHMGLRALRLSLVPLLLGLVSVPAMMVVPPISPENWSLGLATAISNVFPDVLFRYQPDWPFYFVYFLAGWWLYRMRHGLGDVAENWLPCLLIGTVAHVAAVVISESCAPRTGLPNYNLVRLGSYTIYALGGAYTAFGLLGFFQRFLDRPTRIGRYLADTAFWVYLVHQGLLTRYAIGWVSPLALPGGAKALLATAIAVAISLASFELIVRPTPLIHLFGPASSKRSSFAIPSWVPRIPLLRPSR